MNKTLNKIPWEHMKPGLKFVQKIYHISGSFLVGEIEGEVVMANEGFIDVPLNSPSPTSLQGKKISTYQVLVRYPNNKLDIIRHGDMVNFYLKDM